VTKLYTTREAAALLRLSPKTVLRLVKAKKIRHVRYGGKLIFREDDLLAFLEARTFGPRLPCHELSIRSS